MARILSPASALWRGLAGLSLVLGMATALPGALTAQAEEAAPNGMLLEDARVLAQHAWATGNVPLAHALAEAIVAEVPDDPTALTLLAATHPQMGTPEEGQKAGAQAFRAADTRPLRFDAAYVTSAAAMAGENYGAAQYWLRRAYHAAETDAQRDLVADAFQSVRAASPWRVTLNFDVSPTDNVNGGAQSEFLVIEDSPFVGVLSGAARALPGTTTSISGRFSHDISRGARHRTDIALNAYRSFNTLSDEAKEIAPRAEGSDFDYAVAELQLSHRVATPEGPLPDTYRLAFGQTWYGGEELDEVTRATLARSIRLGDRWSLRLSGEAEKRISDRGDADRYGTELRARLGHELAGGTVLHFGAAATSVASIDPNSEYTAWDVEAGFVLAETPMGVRMSGTLGYGELHYPVYSIGFIDVTGGRQQEDWDAALHFAFEGADLMGFIPVVTVRSESSTSNISRFEGESTGLSIGFRSAF